MIQAQAVRWMMGSLTKVRNLSWGADLREERIHISILAV